MPNPSIQFLTNSIQPEPSNLKNLLNNWKRLESLSVVTPLTPRQLLSSQKRQTSRGARKTRVIFDYRKLNQISKKLSHPIPHIPTMLNNLQGGTFYTTLDLKGAFHNLQLTEKARDLAAVITSKGVYRPKRLVFGLSGAPPFFCYVMERVLRGVPNCAVYLDDIIICLLTLKIILMTSSEFCENFMMLDSGSTSLKDSISLPKSNSLGKS